MCDSPYMTQVITTYTVEVSNVASTVASKCVSPYMAPVITTHTVAVSTVASSFKMCDSPCATQVIKSSLLRQ